MLKTGEVNGHHTAKRPDVQSMYTGVEISNFPNHPSCSLIFQFLTKNYIAQKLLLKNVLNIRFQVTNWVTVKSIEKREKRLVIFLQHVQSLYYNYQLYKRLTMGNCTV